MKRILYATEAYSSNVYTPRTFLQNTHKNMQRTNILYNITLNSIVNFSMLEALNYKVSRSNYLSLTHIKRPSVSIYELTCCLLLGNTFLNTDECDYMETDTV